MIKSFRDDWLKEFYLEDKSSPSIPSTIESALKRKLDILNVATAISDLRVPPNNRFEHLKGNLDGWCSIRVNKKYRLIFRWSVNEAVDLYLDPHTYK